MHRKININFVILSEVTGGSAVEGPVFPLLEPPQQCESD